MRKVFCFIVLLISNDLYSQEFLHSNDYIYGEGRGRSIEEADRAALATLANTLLFTVKASANNNASDQNRNGSRYIEQETEPNISLALANSKLYIDDKSSGRRNYRVYRYFNKKEYIETRKKLVDELLNGHDTLRNVADINLKLGKHYRAYQILDDDLMSFLDPNNEETKKYIKEKALRVQKAVQFYESAGYYFYYDMDDFPYIGRVCDYTDKPSYDPKNFYIGISIGMFYKFDFEYWDGTKWCNEYSRSINRSSDLNYSTIFKISSTPTLPRDKFIDKSNKLICRILYAVINNLGEKVIIDVPDDWYYYNEADMFDHDDIVYWLNLDIERKIVSREQAQDYYDSLFR